MGKFTRRRKFEQRDERRYSVMKMLSIEEELKNNSYPGRGVVIGENTGRNEGCDGLLYHGKK